MPVLPPLVILAIGIVTILTLILVVRANAFLALVAAAILVSVLAPGPMEERMERVAREFGGMCGKIGIVIALAAIIGQCMMDSGAADRVVRAFLRALGEKRSSWALMGSGYALSVPVFFDTVFYLLVPLARSLHRRTGRDFLKYVLAISAGAAATHTLVPPTPGPLTMAANFNIDLGWMIMIGALVAAPASVAGLCYAALINRWMPVPMRQITPEEEPPPLADSQLPSLFWSALPVILPVLLISANTVLGSIVAAGDASAAVRQAAVWAAMLGNPNFALFLSTILAIGVLRRQRRMTLAQTASVVEASLMSAGMIILITAAGGAFGKMLDAARVGDAIKEQFGAEGGGGMALMGIGFAVAAVFKIAQGSSTVAMITASAMLASMVPSSGLGFNIAYLATAVGGGSLVGSWMNDSGFWIIAKMSGLTAPEALKSWTIQAAIIGTTAYLVSVLLANVLPLTT